MLPNKFQTYSLPNSDLIYDFPWGIDFTAIRSFHSNWLNRPPPLQLTSDHLLLLNKAGWWLNQPIWKILVKMGNLSQIGTKIKHIWNHHLESLATGFFKFFKKIYRRPGRNLTWQTLKIVTFEIGDISSFMLGLPYTVTPPIFSCWPLKNHEMDWKARSLKG